MVIEGRKSARVLLFPGLVFSESEKSLWSHGSDSDQSRANQGGVGKKIKLSTRGRIFFLRPPGEERHCHTRQLTLKVNILTLGNLPYCEEVKFKLFRNFPGNLGGPNCIQVQLGSGKVCSK